MTEEELEQCWYCSYCQKPMQDKDDGVYVCGTGYCSAECGTEDNS